MINKINSAPKINFKGTTIIEKEGGDIITSEITEATNNSTRGLLNTRLNGYSMVVVEDVFEKEEQNYLKFLDKKGFKYKNFKKIIDYKYHTTKSLSELAKKAFQTGAL